MEAPGGRGSFPVKGETIGGVYAKRCLRLPIPGAGLGPGLPAPDTVRAPETEAWVQRPALPLAATWSWARC